MDVYVRMEMELELQQMNTGRKHLNRTNSQIVQHGRNLSGKYQQSTHREGLN